jgi:hypothetical protein
MRKISSWARLHKWPARLIIILIIYPLLNFTGWCLGALLEEGGLHLDLSWGYVLSLPVLLLFIFYPSKNAGSSYCRRKIFDLSLATISFCFMVLTGNGLAGDNTMQGFSTSGHAAVSSGTVATASKPELRKKGLRKLLKQLRAHYKDGNGAGKAALIILSILLAMGLVILLAGLACGVACGGAEALAYVIFFVGFAGIVFGLVKLIQRISRGPDRRH